MASIRRPQYSACHVYDLVSQDSSLKSLYALAVKSCAGDNAHDLGHLLRVAACSLNIASAGSQLDVSYCREIVAAALLHDLVSVAKNSSNRSRAAELSADLAANVLQEHGFGPTETRRITSAIRDHSFSGGRKPIDRLGKILQDADRLDALGAIGICRVFVTSGKIGSTLFSLVDPWVLYRNPSDSEFAIDHFFTKLLRLPSLMNTRAGKREAKRRARFMIAFLRRLGTEIGVTFRSRPSNHFSKKALKQVTSLQGLFGTHSEEKYRTIKKHKKPRS